MTTAVPPQHGERRCYLRGCRLPECAAANARYCKAYRVARHRTGPRRVDATPYIQIAERYSAAGWSYLETARLAGCSETVIHDLINHLSVRLNPDIAARLDTLPANPSSDGGAACVDATGTIRRGRALCRIGHRVDAMAAELGIHPDALSRILNRSIRHVLASTAREMTILYARWRWTPGPSLANRTRAERLGWHGPLAWDNNIDDPQCRPDTAKPYKAIAKNGRDSNRRAEIAHLLSLGESVASIARQMNANEKYISDLISQGLDEPTYATAA